MTISALLAFAGWAMSIALVVAALVRKPRTVAQYALAGGLCALAVQALMDGLTFASMDGEQRLVYQTYSLLATAAIPGPWLLFSLTYSRGNWRVFVRKWRWLVGAAFVIPGAIAIAFRGNCALGLRSSGPTEWFLEIASPGSTLILFVLLTSIFVLVNLERTFRASVGTMRWRIKYMVLGLGLLFGVQVYANSQILLYSGVAAGIASLQAVTLLFACAMIGLAILRAGLIEVDVYPSRSVIQHSITILIAGVYLFVVGVLAKLLKAVAPGGDFSFDAFLILVGLVGIAVIIFSERLRERIKRAISRHFKRPHHDFRQAWSTFTAQTASLLNSQQLCRAAAQWLSGNLRVLSVSLWLVDEARNRFAFGASTVITEDQASRLRQLEAEAPRLISSLRDRGAPFDIDLSREDWVAVLKDCQPDAFRAGGNRICAPMIAGGELLGFMILGDRVNGVPLSIEDLDLLQCVANQLAGNLLNIRLSEHLLQAREMEAFQTISAFFVHDLKNTASTLSLMLQNLPAHYDNPEFRKDALRGLGKSVDRINELIGRLSLLRQQVHVMPRDVDLNEIAVAAINALNGVSRPIESALASDLPAVRCDADKIHKVITNLLTNAVEASSPNECITLATNARNGWASISVTDTGCGMTAEFINNSLFRPFQTTKKNGIGIGMFLSKMVVEAHGGKIEVDSEPGKGSTFRVLLPIQKGGT